MPRGVAKAFLRILDDDRRVAGRRVWATAVLVAVLAVAAWFLSPPLGVAVHMVAAALGVAIGLLAAGMRHGRYEQRLKDDWESWMDKAGIRDSVPEIDRAVRDGGRGGIMALVVVGVVVLWLAELALLLLSFNDAKDLVMAVPVLVLNGLVAGTLLGYVIRRARWSRVFRASLDELVADGELGVWGTR